MGEMILRGEVVEQEDSGLLRRRIQKLEADLRGAIREAQDARAEVSQVRNSLDAIERFLEPFYKGLRGLFEKFDAVGVGSQQSYAGAPTPPAISAIWEKWKRDLGGKPAAVIDALLIQPEMSVAQLRVATQSGQQTIYDVTSKLNKLGLINKNGGKYSLKKF